MKSTHSGTMPFYSFVIPVYNAERYLAACVGSVSAQAFADWEMILVEDGGSDGSAALCDELARRDPRIRLIRQPNAGAASARNTGLSAARGRYVWFVDADDRIAAGSLSFFADRLRAVSPDLLAFSYTSGAEGESDSLRGEPDAESTGAAALEDPRCDFMVWSKIYSRAFLETHGLRFDEGLSTLEDWLFNSRLYVLAPRILRVSRIGYHYNTGNPGSTQRNRDRAHLLRQAADSRRVHREAVRLIGAGCSVAGAEALRRQLDFSVAGMLYSLFRFRQTASFVAGVLDEYRSLGLYPVATTRNRKANLFLSLANRRALFLLLCRLRAVR